MQKWIQVFSDLRLGVPALREKRIKARAGNFSGRKIFQPSEGPRKRRQSERRTPRERYSLSVPLGKQGLPAPPSSADLMVVIFSPKVWAVWAQARNQAGGAGHDASIPILLPKRSAVAAPIYHEIIFREYREALPRWLQMLPACIYYSMTLLHCPPLLWRTPVPVIWCIAKHTVVQSRAAPADSSSTQRRDCGH